MVGGKIKDLHIKSKGSIRHEVRILVQGTGCEKNDTCCVVAAIQCQEIDKGKVKPGLPIWWQGRDVYISYGGVEDVKFLKLGFSGGNEKSFVAEKESVHN